MCAVKSRSPIISIIRIGVERMTKDENLFEWSEKALGTALYGTYQTQESNRLHEENQELRRQLKRSREISASRLKRLNKPGQQEAKPKAAPFHPRLVAAE